MKKLSAGLPYIKCIAAASAFTWTIAIANSAGAAQLQEARVTQVVNDVKLLLEQGAPRPAAVSDLIRRGNAVRTGTQSRSELTFSDLTITRLGANTIFSFKEGTREMNLIDGAILFQVPKGSGGATIRTVGVTAAITGTTGIGEFHPATTSRPQPFSKWLCLEGTFHLYLPNGQSLELGPGKLVTTNGKSFSKVMTFDIAKLVSTSLFFAKPLASMDLIMLESQNQLASSLLASTTTNPLDPTTIVNVINQASVAEETPSPSATPSITPPPTATPTKFGTPSTITAPNPYLITSGTIITTDPSITTNGVTDFGKIYRGQTDDGTFSLWAFGSTSAFDTALRIDDIFFADPSHLPIAVFKFENLSLTGDPTIDTSNGVTKLALIGLDGITSGPPGDTLTFTGLDLLVLATVNGSINLTSDVSFQHLNELAMYARGTGSDLTINSPISNIAILGLVAEDSIHLTNPGTVSVGKLDAIAGGDLMLQIGGSLLLNGRVRLDVIVLPGASVASGANLTLNVTGDYTNNSATQSSRLTITNRDHIGTGGNIAANIGGNLTAMNDFNLRVQNTNGQIDNGGNISLRADGINVAGTLGATLDNTGGLIDSDTSLTIASSGALSVQGDATFQIFNSDNGTGGGPGQIGGSATINVSTGGDFSANSLTAFINDRHAGSIGSGATLRLDIGRALSTTNDVFAGISMRNDGTGGGTIGSDATVNLSAGSISVGGFFQTFVATNGGGSIQGDAINTVTISGDLRAQQGILVTIEDTIFGGTGNFTGGHIGGNAIVALNAQNIITPSTASGIPGTDLMAIEASIYPNTGGTVGGDAIVNVSASQDISAPGSVLFWVANGNYQNLGPGMIGGNAEVNVSASNISTGDLFTQILNYGGASIGGNAMISVNANTMSVGGNLDALIDNTGGTIGASTEGGATINMNVSSTASVTNDATIAIYGSDGAVGGAAININGGNYNVGGTFLSYIDGDGTITFNNASAHADVLKAGVFGANGALNISGGTLSADSILKLYAPGSNGQLNFMSNVTLGGNSLKILAANSVTIFNNIVVTIGGPNAADVYTNHANYTGFGGNGTTTGTFAGAGANNPQPLASAPPFGPATPHNRTVPSVPPIALHRVPPSNAPPPNNRTNGGGMPRPQFNVRNSDELLALLDDASRGPDGKITIRASKTTNNSRAANRIDATGRSNVAERLNADRRALGIRTASSFSAGRSPQ